MFKKVLLINIFLSINTVLFSSITLKIASIAPEQTPWGLSLNKMAAEWEKASGGEVKVKLYHNAIAGEEKDMLKKIRIGQLDGAVFTSLGLVLVIPEIMTLSAPLLIKTDDEYDYVLEKLKPRFEKKIEEQNFKIIAWSRAGWVRFFSRKPVYRPADIKSQKIGTDPNEESLKNAFKEMGYQQVPVSIPDVLPSLNSGLIEAVYTSPLAAGGFQWFGLAKYMCNMKISPFMGGILLSDKAWKKIPEKYRETFLEINRRIEKEMNKNVISAEDEAVKLMQGYGLIVTEVPDNYKGEWENEFKIGLEKLLGKTFDKDLYFEIQKILAEYRKK